MHNEIVHGTDRGSLEVNGDDGLFITKSKSGITKKERREQRSAKRALQRYAASTQREAVPVTFLFDDGSQCRGVDRDLAVAYCIRNQGGHEVSSSRILSDRLQAVLDHMLGSLCWCIQVHYP